MGYIKGSVFVMSQGEWDALLDTSTRDLDELDSTRATKLDGVEDAATGDQTANEIKIAYHTLAKEFTTIEKGKVDRIGEDAYILEVERGTTEPVSPSNGDLFYNETTQKLRRYTGAIWKDVEFVVKPTT